MAEPRSPGAPATWHVVAAFAAVYLIWGSTYLAIRFAIETLPPFLMAGTRFILAGTVLYAWARMRGAKKPLRIHWRSAAVIGALLLLGGNGGVVWAEQFVPSGLTALLVAVVPIWMVLLEWVRPEGTAPTPAVCFALALGFGGVALLVGPGEIAGDGHADLLGAGVLMLTSFCWAVGSIYARKAPLPQSPFLATAMEMLAGGALLLVVGLATGQGQGLDFRSFSLLSGLSLLYLVIFGSLLGFTAYIWLLGVTTPARVSTYAYVNPVIAVFLGWLLGGELLSLRALLGSAVIVGSVALITARRQKEIIGSDADAKASTRPEARSCGSVGLASEGSRGSPGPTAHKTCPSK